IDALRGTAWIDTSADLPCYTGIGQQDCNDCFFHGLFAGLCRLACLTLCRLVDLGPKQVLDDEQRPLLGRVPCRPQPGLRVVTLVAVLLLHAGGIGCAVERVGACLVVLEHPATQGWLSTRQL